MTKTMRMVTTSEEVSALEMRCVGWVNVQSGTIIASSFMDHVMWCNVRVLHRVVMLCAVICIPYFNVQLMTICAVVKWNCAVVKRELCRNNGKVKKKLLKSVKF